MGRAALTTTARGAAAPNPGFDLRVDNPDPSSTYGNRAEEAKVIELSGWPYLIN
jgi:hypothetical protein